MKGTDYVDKVGFFLIGMILFVQIAQGKQLRECKKYFRFDHYRPQMKFAKVMILQVFVCPQWGMWWGGMHGSGACMAVGHEWQWGMHGRGHAWQGCVGGACVAGGVHGRGTCMAGVCMVGGGGHVWQGVCMQ